jgi:hypothetical protein
VLERVGRIPDNTGSSLVFFSRGSGCSFSMFAAQLWK